MNLVKFFSYSTLIFPLVPLFNFAVSGNPREIGIAVVPTLVAYLAISGLKKGKSGFVKIGGVYFGISAFAFGALAFNLTISNYFGFILLFILSGFCAFGCYVLVFKKSTLDVINSFLQKGADDELNLRAFDYNYKGYEIFKSPKYYWHNEHYFLTAKAVEAHIENTIAENT